MTPEASAWCSLFILKREWREYIMFRDFFFKLKCPNCNDAFRYRDFLVIMAIVPALKCKNCKNYISIKFSVHILATLIWASIFLFGLIGFTVILFPLSSSLVYRFIVLLSATIISVVLGFFFYHNILVTWIRSVRADK